MMLAQLRRDPLVGWPTAKWIVIAALNASVVFGVFTGMMAWYGGAITPAWANTVTTALLIWFPLGFIFFQGPFGQRCCDLDLGLPIHARKLWLSHLIVSVLGGGILLITCGGLLGLFHLLAGRLVPGFASLAPQLQRLALPCSAMLLLVVVLLQNCNAPLHRIPHRKKFRSYAALMLAAGYVLILLLSNQRLPVSLIVVALALFIAYRTYRSVPPSFTVAAHEPGSRKNADSTLPSAWVEISGRGRGAGRSFVLVLTRAAFQIMSKKRFGLVLAYLFLVLWGLVISGYIGKKLGWNEDLALYYITLTLYTLLVPLLSPLARMYPLDPLPISRRLLFAFLVWPSVLALSAGYAAGWLALPAAGEAALVQFQRRESPCQFPPYPLKYPAVRVPAQYCRIAWDGKVPQNTSPWGESHDAWQMPLFRGSRIKVFSPFSTPRESSATFVALQLSRAVEAVYGRIIPSEVIRDRYLVDTEAGVVLKEEEIPLLRDYQELRPPGIVHFYPTLALVVVVASLALMIVYLRTCRASLGDWVRKATFVGILSGTMALHLAFLVSFMTGFIRPDAASTFWRVFVYRASLALPGGELAVWFICVLVLAGVYRLTEGEFQRIELPTPRAAREE